jgi:O-antigen/teichoic acid export membrane protein
VSTSEESPDLLPQPPDPTPDRGRGLAGHSLVYFAGSTVAVAGGVLMLPLYTHALSTGQYGTLETLLRFVGICMQVGYLGVRQAYIRVYFDNPSPGWHRTVTSTVLVLNFLIALVVIVPLLTVSAFVGNAFGLPDMSIGLVVVLVLWLAFEGTFLQGLTSLQVQLKSTQYVVAQCGRLVLLLGTNYLLLHTLKLQLRGALLGNLLTALISGCVAALFLFRQAGLRPSRSVMGKMIRLGLPYIPSVVFVYIYSNADRIAVISFSSIATLGLLSLASKIGEMTLSVFASPIESVWSPYALARWNTPSGSRDIGLLYTRYLALAMLLALGVSLAAPLAVRVLAAPSYRGAAELVPIYAAGWVLNLATTMSDIGLLIAKRTGVKALITATVAVTAVLMQLALTPRLGIYGAALGTALTYGVFFIITRVAANRCFRMTVSKSVFVTLLLGLGAGFAVGRMIMSALPPVLGDLAGITAGTLIYIGALFASRLVTVRDVTVAVRKAAERIARS